MLQHQQLGIRGAKNMFEDGDVKWKYWKTLK
jgi:hypothetical protein